MKTYKIEMAVIICLAVFASACTSQQRPVKKSTNDSLQVSMVAARKGSLSTLVDIPGQLLPYLSVDLYSKENGYVKTLGTDIGAGVTKNQVLLTLEAPEMESQFAQAQADVNTRLATYKGSKANYERLVRASQLPGTISPNDLDIALAKASADSASWKASVANYTRTKELLSYLVVRAPFDGVITARNVSPGAYVSPGDKTTNKPMLSLQERDKLRLTMNVAENYTGYIHMGDTVNFQVSSLPGREFKARVSRMAGGINLETRTEQIEMDVDNRDHQLLPQMYADIRLPIKGDNQDFIIPRTALVMSDEQIFVIKSEAGRAVRVGVTKTLDNAKNVAVRGPLKEGDQLIMNATSEIRDGARLKTM
jgi:membrane fusion protein (multidrug efflux system)